MVSILTQKMITQIFHNSPQFDLRTLLGGTDKFLDSMSHRMNRDASFFLNSIRCLRMSASVRNQASI
jgi:hypothetical protein